ncbi:Outer envelope pore protein 24 [Ranunculus cassubicifolius]
MMKTSLKGKYESDKNSTAAATFSINAGDVKLKASMSDATFVNGPSLNGLALSLEKPGSFIVDYNVPKQNFRFQFMNTVKIAEKPLRLNYIHFQGENRTSVDGTLVFDADNKVSANYMFGTGNCKLKYTYVHGGVMTFEPSYDVSKNTWDFALSQRVFGDDVFKAHYQTSSKVLGLDWSRNSKINGTFKISASVNLAEEVKKPKLTAESTWDFEM